MSRTPTTDDSLPVDIREHYKLPEPTKESPYAQVEWVFDRVISTKTKKSTRKNYVTGKSFYLEHLRALGLKDPYYLQKEWGALALLRFREQLSKRIEAGEVNYASYTLVGIFSAMRYVMNYAAKRGMAGCVRMLDVMYGSGTPETNVTEAYPDSELIELLDAIGSELSISRKILSGYTPQPPGAGRDPRIFPRKSPEEGFGYRVEANMRWYFENVLNCVPVMNDEAGKREHNSFLGFATREHGGLNDLYRRWGVSTFFDFDMLMPHVVNLAYLTGLNPGPLAALAVDAYGESHPATGTPYLRYVKDKVSKELELYLELFDKEGDKSSIDESVLLETTERFLPRKQATQIARTIELIRKATEPLRSSLPEDHPLKNRLLIYTSRGPRTFGQTQGVNSKKTSSWCAQIVEKYGLVGEDGEALNFNLVRFRSTKLTELALQGRDILTIQLFAGHKGLKTTIGYLSRKKLEVEARKVVRDALATIHANRMEFDDPDACARTKNATATEQPIHLYRGLLSDCKNPFDPPKRVRASKSYVPGRACSRFNMCIFCKNVVIFRRNLPTLVAYLDQIKAATETNVQNLPNAGFYEDSRAVIENLLDPERSEFSAEDIRWAREEAARLNPLVDNAVYRGVA